MTHVFSQLTPFVLSYPLWLFVSAMCWMTGHVTERFSSLKMYAAFAIVIAAAIFVGQGH